MRSKAEQQSLLTEEDLREVDAALTGMEAVCQRCGSHPGHIVSSYGGALHCTQGNALVFTPSEA